MLTPISHSRNWSREQYKGPTVSHSPSHSGLMITCQSSSTYWIRLVELKNSQTGSGFKAFLWINLTAAPNWPWCRALGYRLDDRGLRFRFPAGAGKFSLHHRVQTGSGAHPASYPMGTRGPFPGGKADHSPPSSAEVKECVELCFHSPNTPSWRGA
jgi:hypothetical protein